MSDEEGNVAANPKYVDQQYSTRSNLDVRLKLYRDYADPDEESMYRWMFGHVNLVPGAAILELGCGTGALWAENRDRLCENLRVVLTDSAPAMLEAARSSLPGTSFEFKSTDAQDIGFDDGSFDVVIANHMLYHVPDRRRALKEIRRVLRPGGRFFGTTNGWTHLIELRSVISRFCPSATVLPPRYVPEAFDIDNGARELDAEFSELKVHRRRGQLRVTEVADLLAYVRSTIGPDVDFQDAELAEHLTEHVRLLQDFEVTTSVGLLEATR